MSLRLAAAVLLALVAPAAPPAGAQTYPPVQPLLSTTTDVLGASIVWPEGEAKLTAAVVSVLPGAATGLHRHLAPMFAWVLEGEITPPNAAGASGTDGNNDDGSANDGGNTELDAALAAADQASQEFEHYGESAQDAIDALLGKSRSAAPIPNLILKSPIIRLSTSEDIFAKVWLICFALLCFAGLSLAFCL